MQLKPIYFHISFGFLFLVVLLIDTDNSYAQEQSDTGFMVPVPGDTLFRFLPPPDISLPFVRPVPGLYYIDLDEEQVLVERDTSGMYRSQRYLFDIPVTNPLIMSFDNYSRRSREYAKMRNWQNLIDEARTTRDETGGPLDFRLDIPAGDESTFSTIFGKPEVNLRINGTANMNAGASIQKTENPEIPADQQTQIDPTFQQNLRLNIQGTIGDKLSIQTDWDTEAAFDFQNRLSITYQGYEDEILQRMEMGNVAMETGNSLIRGGNSLFGVKGIARLGSLRLTSVLSQQEGENNTETITGGSQEQDIAIRPADYEADSHFFLDFYTRQEFEPNMSDPQQTGQALQFSEINVWVLRESTQSFQGERQAIALVDLGVVQNPDGSYAPPDQDLDPFDQAVLDQFRDLSEGVSASDFAVDSEEFVEGFFIPLEEGADYELDRNLGFISLKRNLNSRQALAVSFKYRDPQTGETISVGDVSQSGGNRIYLKLIRPQNLTTTNPAWDLMMKNIYSLGASNLTPDGLDIDVKYTEMNIPSSSLPERSSILLQDLGLDRVDQQGALIPDNNIDFSTRILNPANGRILFPYLQPFGDRIADLLAETPLSQDEIDDITFSELYTEKKTNANQISKNNFYLIEGQARGGISDSYSLGYSLVEGSVNVFANGRELQEGTDYAVDYSIGSITILNEQYLRRGQELRIEYENNQLAQIAQKSFTGLRAEYDINNNISFGSTYFRLKEKPIQDKIQIGDEPVNNAVLGFDANAYFDAPWLTRGLNNIPLLQTKEPSSLVLSGEFAQLSPGVSQTNAVRDAIRDNRLFEDEENGLSYIDDFEGVDIGLSFMNTSRWSLAAAPAAVPGYEPDDIFFDGGSFPNPEGSIAEKIARSDLRSTFAWYSIPQNIDNILGGVETTPESEPVRVTDVFPNRDVLTEENFINTLDVYFDPTQRGPYNYNSNMRNLLENEPGRTWGGMTATLPSGQEDLTQNNIEFIEFWVQPVLPGGRQPTAQDLQDYDGKIFIDVGVVSEDVVPNFKTNSEDGLVRRPSDLRIDNNGENGRSYIPSPPPSPEGQFSNETRELEDVGLDGAPNSGGVGNRNERNLFSEFIENMQAAYGVNTSEFQKIRNDPSNDDYVYYGEEQVEGLALHERFHRMYGYHEGNSPPSTDEKRAVTNKPDTEGLITPSIVEQNNAYFQYEVDWNPADIENLDVGEPGTFIVDKVPGSNQQDRWYQVRIPLQEYIRRVGNIENFQNISYIRIWMSGYEEPFTLRFATFELVGSQWRNADDVDREQNSQAELAVSSVNIEENSLRQPVPYRQPEGAIRATNRGRQRQTIANEQSIMLDVQDLGPGQLKMIKRVYPGGMNMVNYSNVRMFVHGEGYDNRNEAELVVRFGTDLVNNYYEYRQPVTPTDENYPFSQKIISELTDAERLEEAEQVWLYDENSMNVILRAFNELKQLRDQQQDDPSQVFERSNLLENTPPGAVIAIKGNPSLDRIGEIGMGIRNPFDPQNPEGGGVPSLDARFWLNELRVSGFDNDQGWAANAKSEINFADFATLNANLNRETDGFGALDSRLGQRRISEVFAYNLNSTINLHKFIPERYGWNIPVNLSTRQSSSTPRYLPNQGDVRLSEFKRAVNSRTDISDVSKDALIEQRVHESQTVSESYSINFSNVTKNRSESAFSQYTLDNITTNYVYNTTHRRSPEYNFRDNWNYSGSLRYSISFSSTQLFRPFDFLGEVPLLHPLAGLRFGYTPASLNASTGIDRSYNEQHRRSLIDEQENALQQSHRFTYNTQFGFAYNFMPSVKTSFRSRTVFDLSRAGIDRDDPAIPLSDSTRFTVRPSFDVLNDVIFDSLSSRRNDYDEAYTAGWQPRLNNIQGVDWVRYSANYSGGYQWRNSPHGSGLGATISNNLALNQSLDLDIRSLLDRMEWYRNLQEGSQSSPSEDTSSEFNEDDLGRGLAEIGRRSLKALLSIQSLDIAFSISQNSLQGGYGGDSQIFYMFNSSGDNFSPPFSYRTGAADDIGLSRLISNPFDDRSIHIPSNNNLSDDLSIGSRFQPFNNFSIDLTWNTAWSVTNSRSTTIDPSQSMSSVRTQNGRVSSSIWAFGEGYGALFRRQLETAFEDINSTTVISDSAGNNDGRAILDKKTLQEDFRKAYLKGSGTSLGERDFTPFPLPGWQITWSGIERFIPYLGDMMARASIRHTYSGLYRLGWVFNSDTSLLPSSSLGVYSIQNRRREFEPNTINIEKRFTPLLGLNITWESNLRTNLQYDHSQITSLSLSNTNITERLSRGLKFTFSYTVRDFKIPLFPRFENAVDFTINTSYTEDTEDKFVLNSDLSNALEAGPESIIKEPDFYDYSRSFTGGQARFNGSAIVGYQFSQMIKANFEYSYNRLIPKSSRVFARTDHDIRFNIIVSLRSD